MDEFRVAYKWLDKDCKQHFGTTYRFAETALEACDIMRDTLEADPGVIGYKVCDALLKVKGGWFSPITHRMVKHVTEKNF